MVVSFVMPKIRENVGEFRESDGKTYVEGIYASIEGKILYLVF